MEENPNFGTPLEWGRTLTLGHHQNIGAFEVTLTLTHRPLSHGDNERESDKDNKFEQKVDLIRLPRKLGRPQQTTMVIDRSE